MRIDIDFVAGSHGNYLEFVLNKLLLGDAMRQDHPFSLSGASHNKPLEYRDTRIVFSDHYFITGGSDNDNIILIEFTGDDLLSLMSVSLDRAGDYGIIDNDLHVDTYKKLNNIHYRMVLDNILSKYNEILGYNDIKSDSWPEIDTVEDFYNLPIHIIRECQQEFGFTPKLINEHNPDIDRNILREFFKFGFKDTKINGLILQLNRMAQLYNKSANIYRFSYNNFYDYSKFQIEIRNIKDFFNLQFNEFDLYNLHNLFLEKQNYKDLKIDTDCIIQSMLLNETINAVPALSLFQESYIDAVIENKFNIKLPLNRISYFHDTYDIVKFINKSQNEI